MSNKTFKPSNIKASGKRTLKNQRSHGPAVASSRHRKQTCDTLPVVTGLTDDGEFQYFHYQDIEYDDDGDPRVEARSANSSAGPGEPIPLLALKWGGGGLWIGHANEWLTDYDNDVPDDDGVVAYTMKGVSELIKLAGPGDMLIPLGSCVLQPKI